MDSYDRLTHVEAVRIHLLLSNNVQLYKQKKNMFFYMLFSNYQVFPTSLYKYELLMFLLNISPGDRDSTVDRSEVGAKPKLKELVQFICGTPHLPSGNQKIKVKFTRGSLPDPETCFDIIKLPLSHSCYTDFERAMNLAVNCQHVGYARG